MPFNEPSTDLIILSDLHLSSGPFLSSGSRDPLEQFAADQAFVHFLEHLLGEIRQETKPRRLLFLGDFLDFLHARVGSHRMRNALDIDSSETAAHEKLERIFAGHPIFFETLGRLAASGFHIDLVPGNHDIDLIRPRIQSHFIDLLVNAGREAKIASNVHFFPWLYVIPGLLYAEHGNQYHDLNSFATLLSPYHHRRPDALELPLGSYFDTLIHHLVEQAGASDPVIQSPIRYLVRKFIKHPASLVHAFPDIFRFKIIALKLAAYRASPACASRQRAYQASNLTEYAAGLGLDFRTVQSLDRLRAAPNFRTLVRLLRGAVTLQRQEHGGYLFKAARSIHKVLQADGIPVPFYVFGHSHHAAKLKISDGSPAWYLNSGTWTEAPSSSVAVPRNTFPYIHVVKELDVQDSSASLLRWNESLKLVEPLA